MSITIDKEFEALIPPLTSEEFQQLEENCLKEGIRDALITWNGVLIDGHNRFKIAAKHGLMWNEKRMEFVDRDAAIEWIIDNQLGRRNIHILDREALMSKKREALERQAKKRQIRKPKDFAVEKFPQQKTRDIIGKELGVSGRQVDKLHTINEKATPEVKQQIRDGEKSINGAYNDIKEQERRRIDLSAKAHLEKAEERHKDFQESKTVSITDVAQDRKDTAEIAQSKYNEIYNAIKKILFIGASNFDYSIINTKTMDANDIRRLQGELSIAADILKKIREEIGG